MKRGSPTIVSDVMDFEGKRYPFKRVQFEEATPVSKNLLEAFAKKFSPFIVNDKNEPVDVQGAGFLPWFRANDRVFPQLPAGNYLVFGVRLPSDWSTNAASRQTQLDIGGGWVADGEDFASTTFREFREEYGYPVLDTNVQDPQEFLRRVNEAYFYQPFEKKIIATALVELNEQEAQRLPFAAEFLCTWDEAESLHLTDSKESPITQTTKTSFDAKEGVLKSKTTTEVGARKALQAIVAVNMEDLRKLFETLDQETQVAKFIWLEKLLARLQALKLQRDTAQFEEEANRIEDELTAVMKNFQR
jgi:8-oxo-dGTP pyrophosphatase MutT (NUDIX family)